MTEFKKTWRVREGGALLGTIDIISPWTGGPTEAVVNIDNGEVIAAHGATCPPFQLSMPDSIFRGELREHMPEIAAPVMALPKPVLTERHLTLAREIGFTEDEIASWGEGVVVAGNPAELDYCEGEPIALTDEALPVMEAWIRKRGFAPFTNPDTGKVVILCTECLKEECLCPIPF